MGQFEFADCSKIQFGYFFLIVGSSYYYLLDAVWMFYIIVESSFHFLSYDLVWITLLIVGFSLDILTNHWILFVCFKSLLDRVS